MLFECHPDRQVFVVLLLVFCFGLLCQAQQGETRLKNRDIGNPSLPGSTATKSDGMQILAGGKDIWGSSDQFHFAYCRRKGNFDIQVRLESLTATHLYTKAGLMAREDLTPESRHVFFLVFPDNQPRHLNSGGYELQFRENKAGESKAIYPSESTGPPPFPVVFPNGWLRLRRVGDEFSAFVSQDGKNWTTYASHNLHLPPTVFLGLAVTSHSANSPATAEFRELRVSAARR